MLHRIIRFSLRNKLIVLLFTLVLVGFGLYSLGNIPIGAVPDVTNNQVQVITTSRNLSTQDMERFITYPIELEMANLPGVEEIRSISKFGISVVTIVFEDDMGTYLPRQLIAEKIKVASERIPEGFGSPQMGPITTGLGEIYQYVLDVDPKYKDQYSAMDLRTIQDWVVRRQLSGIPGVVEVNTWGGYLKQYEIAVKTDRLKAMDITMGDLLGAVERNNSVSGGGYIEKISQAYFIRGEGLATSLEDLKNTVVKTVNGSPVYIRDVATVGFGNATRFGAITGNGEGEKVLGQVMMLKGANSKQVIEAVKARVDAIAGTLPEGISINAFLDRSELIARTTATVEENLILGCLIVIFVVVLLLGNLRSGLVVASVIPLSLLFALSMMYVFGVDANLMSLGAIDFGIIIDGAVIIVEFIAFRITGRAAELESLQRADRRALQDEITLKGASKLMNSAVFGQLIILIVFIPILALSGVEGKMFRPMALTFSFALIGAMLMCFTYVPVMASLVLKPSRENRKRNISQRLVPWLTDLYSPSLDWALTHKKTVIGLAAGSLLVAGFLFARMGAEFVPTLDEGDFVIQPVLKTGTSLSKTIETTTKIEKILMEQFPEVDQVVTRIGAAEVPTDPMSMEESDVIITLKPPSEWVSADSKDGLANQFKEALSVIPGMEVEFTQPIEMRFNELITGVRADIAIKVFGEDLSVLARLGEQIRGLAAQVPGAADISVEKIEGLPQLNIAYDRTKIARYGLNIQDLNRMLSLAYAGQTVGNVFEGERMFDLVVRLDPAQRNNLEEIQELYVDLPGGGKVPLGEVARISYQEGAAKISRDNTRRRLVVGINVRDRDLQSVVDDVQALVAENLILPTGYSITYGGQFENLQSAKARLKIAVPIALILIFLMLYFAFNSLKEALVIFSAIPLAAVGGVLLLWVRDMPFSISAGVGFIALFGIAVLNGIVLIEHFKELRHDKNEDIELLIRQGALDRLRAVLLTASAAALGFLPMAVSTNAGAEVQRPLATVVIGGLVSATLLTLIVLPVLYSLLSREHGPKVWVGKPFRKTLTVLTLFGVFVPALGQQQPVGLDSLLHLAEVRNAGVEASRIRWEAAEAGKGTALDFGKTEVFYGYDQNNLANGQPLEVFGLRQGFAFPTVYAKRFKAGHYQAQAARSEYEMAKRTLGHQLSLLYNRFLVARQKARIYEKLDSLYLGFAAAADRRFELGATNYLEKVTARSRQRQTRLQLQAANTRAEALHREITGLVQAENPLVLADPEPIRLMASAPELGSLPEVQLLTNRLLAQRFARQTQEHLLLPDLSLEYFQGSNSVVSGNLEGYSLGVSIPLFFNGQASRIRMAKKAEQAQIQQNKDQGIQLQSRLEQLQTQLRQQNEAMSYYETEGKALSEAILKAAEQGFRNGEIDFFQYIQSLENSYEIRLSYLDQLERYNETVLNINYLSF
ncbi:CusA/CzcA family heavy metal efflux RND transporter [Robiginitalea sp. M366]|uniref:CusA/CzcA family heavy metal efflux RND transporter n=1 Tax=Robiginitalea aestuariiviva TaxID=3036903 RepID=UPI00240D2A51|nr:CusA/CzcA family heavy metal efflux RND transporter [Robiginitalea aestuariiviva]MDG1571264.1 CusA/CzcA family heavy metal efflux RND transporter [Robiginitalea aestuariiviva]